jgi:hypothetical protein
MIKASARKNAESASTPQRKIACRGNQGNLPRGAANGLSPVPLLSPFSIFVLRMNIIALHDPEKRHLSYSFSRAYHQQLLRNEMKCVIVHPSVSIGACCSSETEGAV